MNYLVAHLEDFGYPLFKSCSKKPPVDNQHDLFMQFSCHELQRMVVMDNVSSTKGRDHQFTLEGEGLRAKKNYHG
jgi:hypothetical protein